MMLVVGSPRAGATYGALSRTCVKAAAAEGVAALIAALGKPREIEDRSMLQITLLHDLRIHVDHELPSERGGRGRVGEDGWAPRCTTG